MQSADIKEYIRGEVTRQLQQLKKTIDEEHAADIAELKTELTKLINIRTANVSADINRQNEAINKIAAEHNQITVAGGNSQIVSRDETKRMITLAVQRAGDAVYKEVIGEINSKIVPKVDRMISYVNYQMQDGQSMVTDYRKAVHNQKKAESAGLLTNGGDTSHILSENVQLFFTTDD